MLLFLNLLIQIPNFYYFSNKLNNIELGTIYNSLCHSTFTSTLSVYYLINPTDYIYNLISSYSQIYLLIDLLAINYYPELKKYKFAYSLHHILFLFCYSLVNKDIYKYIICKLLLAEISVVFLNLRFISKFHNLGYTNELSYLTYIAFFIFRIIHMPILFYKDYNVLVDVYGNYTFIPMYILQLNWFYNMTLKLISHLKNKND